MDNVLDMLIRVYDRFIKVKQVNGEYLKSLKTQWEVVMIYEKGDDSVVHLVNAYGIHAIMAGGALGDSHYLVDNREDAVDLYHKFFKELTKGEK